MELTKEQWQEIYEARARLEAYRDKIQPYPAYPETQQPEPETHFVDTQWTSRQWDAVSQLRAKVLFLERKVNEKRKRSLKNVL